ncbi:glycosyltransferase family 4 protein [Salinicoccus roseus]|uniref:glycosyltransferase family 4 protein n=1 Tax=Salinicoccus roseus TaxID=45670 RepID=UPI003525E84A
MKVAHICTSSLSHKVLVDKLELLNQENYTINLISSSEGYDERILRDTTFEIKFIDMKRNISPISDVKSIFNLAKLLKREKYEVIHTHTAKAGLIGRVAGRLAGIPLVIHTSHGLPYYEGQNRLKYGLYKNFEKLGSRFSHILLSQNYEDLHKLEEISQGRAVLYEGNGVDIDKVQMKLARSKKDVETIKKKYAPNGEFLFLMAARFEEIKDHDFLIDGVDKLVRKYNQNNFVFLLAGQGELEDAIKAKIKKLNLEDYIKIIGFQENIYKFINLSDAVILTSQKEGLPRIIMESMVAHKLVIGTDVLGTRELIEEDKTGLLIRYKDIEHLASQLDKALVKNLDHLKENAHRKIIENFTEQIVVKRLDNIYKRGYKVKKLTK